MRRHRNTHRPQALLLLRIGLLWLGPPPPVSCWAQRLCTAPGRGLSCVTSTSHRTALRADWPRPASIGHLWHASDAELELPISCPHPLNGGNSSNQIERNQFVWLVKAGERLILQGPGFSHRAGQDRLAMSYNAEYEGSNTNSQYGVIRSVQTQNVILWILAGWRHHE